MRLRSAVFWLLLGALVIVALLHVGEIEKVLHLLRSLRWQWLAATGIAQCLTYITTAWALQGILATLDVHLPWRRVWRSVVAFVLGWQTVPTAGVGGLVLWSMGLSQLGVQRESAVASGILYDALDYIAFFALLATGVLILLLEHSLPTGLLVPLVLLSVVILAVVAVAVGLLSHEARVLAVVNRLVHAANSMLGWLGRAPLDAVPICATTRRFYENWRTLGIRWRSLVRPAMWILAARLLDVLTLQLLFAAVGYPMAWGALTLGFVYANFASIASILPTGLGILDASLVLLYSWFGAPLAIAVVVTLLFRFLAYWLPIPYGLYIYHRIAHAPTGGV